MFTAPSMQLGSRASKKYSAPNAWHNQFYSLVTTKIDEDIFKPLFPEGKKSGRPNASIRILVAMSVLKEGFGCSDEDLFEKQLYHEPFQLSAKRPFRLIYCPASICLPQTSDTFQ